MVRSVWSSVCTGHTACVYTGSENNAVYVYSKQVSRPMLTYQYSTARGILVRSSITMSVYCTHVTHTHTQPTSATGDSQPEPNEFVSAVCWMKGSSVLLAANSQGHIKVSTPANQPLLGAYLVMLFLQVLEMC